MMLSGGFQSWTANILKLLQSIGVLILGLAVYLPLFGCLGGTIKRPVLAGLLYIFGWEATVGMFPGNAKLFTIVHYLHILFPKMQQIQLLNARSALLEMVMPAKQISPVITVLILCALSVLFTFILSSLDRPSEPISKSTL